MYYNPEIPSQVKSFDLSSSIYTNMDEGVNEIQVPERLWSEIEDWFREVYGEEIEESFEYWGITLSKGTASCIKAVKYV